MLTWGLWSLVVAGLAIGGLLATPGTPPAGSDAVTANARTAAGLIAALERKEAAAVLAPLATDAAFVLPLAPDGDNDPGNVDRFVGPAAIRGAMEENFARYARIEFVDPKVTPSADGRTVFVEAFGDFLTADGRPYRNVYLFRLDFDAAGKVVRIEEWNNPVTAALTWGFPLGPATPAASPAGGG